MSTATEAAPDTQHDDTEAPRARYAVLDGRSCKALALACSDESTRPLLQYARVRPDATFEATNGHLLTRMAPRLQDADGIHTEDRMDHKGWLVHRDDLKRLKVSQALRLDLETGELVVLDKNGEPEIAIPGGASTEETEGAFPDTDRVYNVHTRPECLRVRLAGQYLKSLAKLARAEQDEGVTLEIPLDVEDKTSGGRYGAPRGVRYTTGKTEGLLMPMRMD